jgi:signal transduction histidine kinase
LEPERNQNTCPGAGVAGGEELCLRLLGLSSQIVFQLKLLPRPKMQFVSPHIGRLLGGTQTDYLDAPGLLLSLLYQKDRQDVERALKDSTVEILSQTLRFVRADGNLIHLDALLTILRGPGGKAEVMEGIMRDVTLQDVNVEEQRDLLYLSEIERRWVEAVLKQSPVAMLLVRKGGSRVRIEANQKLDELLPSFKEGAREPNDFLNYFRKPTGEGITYRELPLAAALQGETLEGQEYLIEDSGKRTPVLVHATPVIGLASEIIGAVVLIEDISDQKERARLRREWSHVMAHDLKQPLSNILLFSSMMEANVELSEQFRKPLVYIQASAQQLTRMVDDLTDLSRLEAKNLKLERRAIELIPLLEEIIDRFRHEYPARSFLLRNCQVLPPLNADSGRLQQVFGNLISNALKYGYPNTPVVIDCGFEDRGNIRVSVCNEGEGLNADELPLLFQRFQRVRKGAFARIKGTGLGLYLSRGLVEAHGGEIRVESVPGKTTIFHVVLPVDGADDSNREDE